MVRYEHTSAIATTTSQNSNNDNDDNKRMTLAHAKHKIIQDFYLARVISMGQTDKQTDTQILDPPFNI